MSQGPLCPNLTQKVQMEVSQMANRNLSSMILLGGLSVNLNHLKSRNEATASFYVHTDKIMLLWFHSLIQSRSKFISKN